MYSVVHVYTLGLTLRANVNYFYKFFDIPNKGKCKCLNLTIVSVYGVMCKCRLV
jgi:hypothetical protein